MPPLCSVEDIDDVALLEDDRDEAQKDDYARYVYSLGLENWGLLAKSTRIELANSTQRICSRGPIDNSDKRRDRSQTERNFVRL